MATTDVWGAVRSLSPEDRVFAISLGTIFDRIATLPKADRDDLFELVTALRDELDPAERDSIHDAMFEILVQKPVTARPMPLGPADPLGDGRRKWAEHVGAKVRELREATGLTQQQLADKADLQQSHVSRIENAELTATAKTLSKIAAALGVPLGQIDPSAAD